MNSYFILLGVCWIIHECVCSIVSVVNIISDLSLFQLGETSDKEKETQQFDMQVITNCM